MSEEKSITIPPVAEIRRRVTEAQAEVRQLRKLLLLAKAVEDSTNQRLSITEDASEAEVQP